MQTSTWRSPSSAGGRSPTSTDRLSIAKAAEGEAGQSGLLAEVLRFEYQVLDQRLVFGVSGVLDRAPALAFLRLQVGPVLRSAGESHVVGDDDRPRMEPSLP